jgi:hypothetical protein
LSRTTRADLVQFHRVAWVASRSIIAVCGDVEPEHVRTLLDRRLARWRSGADLVTTPPSFPPLATRTKTFDAERAQVHVYLGHLGIRRSDMAALLDRVQDGHGARQADYVLNVVRSIMNWYATRHDDYTPPIVRGMKRQSAKAQARARILSDEEIRDLETGRSQCRRDYPHVSADSAKKPQGVDHEAVGHLARRRMDHPERGARKGHRRIARTVRSGSRDHR